MSKLFRETITNNSCKGKCSNCGECCTEFLPITKKEYYIIKDYLVAHPEIKEFLYIEGDDVHLLCPFRDIENKRCSIYPVRPLVCRKFTCNKTSKSLEETKAFMHSRAFFNHMDLEKKQLSNLVSFHNLFFGNIQFEVNVLWALSEFDSVLFKAITSNAYSDYTPIWKTLDEKVGK